MNEYDRNIVSLLSKLFTLPPLPNLFRFNSTGTECRSRTRKFYHSLTIRGERQRVISRTTNQFVCSAAMMFSQILRQFESWTQTGKKLVNGVPKEGGCRLVGRRGGRGGRGGRKIESRISCSRREEGPWIRFSFFLFLPDLYIFMAFFAKKGPKRNKNVFTSESNTCVERQIRYKLSFLCFLLFFLVAGSGTFCSPSLNLRRTYLSPPSAR